MCGKVLSFDLHLHQTIKPLHHFCIVMTSVLECRILNAQV